MTNFVELQKRIADEVARNDLEEQIKKSIKSAIEYYKRKKFYFNQKSLLLDVTAKKDIHTLPRDVLRIERVVLIDQQNAYILDKGYLKNLYKGYGIPIEYHYQDYKFTLSPIPFQNYQVQIDYIAEFKKLEDGSDSNEWLIEAEELIRSRAKADLYANVIRDFDEALVMRSWNENVFQKMLQDTERLNDTGKIKATLF